MAKEKITVQIGDEKIELKCEELSAFLADREATEKNEQSIKDLNQELKETKISAYTKFGLTQKEIKAIL